MTDRIRIGDRGALAGRWCLAVAGLAGLLIVLGLLLPCTPALAAGDGIKLSAPKSVSYGSKITFTVSGDAVPTRSRGGRVYPPNLVLVYALTSPSAHCSTNFARRASTGHLEPVLRFHSATESKALGHYQRTGTVKPSKQAYGLCAYLLSFPEGHLYAHAAAYWRVNGHAITYTLTVTLTGPSGGGVEGYTDAGVGDSIQCAPAIGGSQCSHSYSPGTVVHLSENSSSLGTYFGGWSGACSGANEFCNVKMQANEAVTATFEQASGF